MHGPPRYGKSVIIGQRLIPWLLMHNPEWRCPLMTYNVEHSAEFGETIRDLMRGDVYKSYAPPEAWLEREDCSAKAFRTIARARRLDGDYSFRALGFQTGFTGKGADCCVIDDPYASPDDAVSEAINGRTIRTYTQQVKLRVGADKPLVVMYHRYHEADLGGELLAEGGWQHLRFPCIADSKDNEDGSDITNREDGELLSDLWPREHIEEIQRKDPQTFLSMYQGRPRPPEGSKIKREWLRSIPKEEIPRLTMWCRFWDLTAAEDKRTNDFFAGALVGIGPDHTIYLRDMKRFRGEWPLASSLIADTTEMDAAWCRDQGMRYVVGVEKVFWQMAMIQDLFKKGIFDSSKQGCVQLWPIPPQGKKVHRAAGWVARASNDKFRMALDTAWNSDFVNECIVFDGLELTHDDQIDAVSGAHNLLWMLLGDVIEDVQEPELGSIEYFRRQRQERNELEDPDLANL